MGSGVVGGARGGKLEKKSAACLWGPGLAPYNAPPQKKKKSAPRECAGSIYMISVGFVAAWGGLGRAGKPRSFAFVCLKVRLIARSPTALQNPHLRVGKGLDGERDAFS